MNKQQLAAKIWAGAKDLRGKVSASSYKDYMLGLIFYKYLSNKEEKYLKEKLYFESEDLKKLTEEDIETVNNCKSNIGYFIAYKDLFSTWIKEANDFQIKSVRTALSAFNVNVGKNYMKVYDGIFNTLETGIDSLGTVDGERTKAVRKLINLINEIPTDSNQEYDVLGFVYEFLLKNFAANAGKAGEFYTPHEASYLMSEIIAHHLRDRENISIYDPTSGSGSLLINIGKTISKHIENPNKIKYYAQELIENTYNLTRMNLIMRDILPNNIVVRNGDTLADDWPFFDDNDKDKTYDPVFVDAAISNPPYSQTWATDNAENDIRFSGYGVAPKSKADYAFLLHNLYHLKPDGIMTIVLPHGVLFRGGDEAKIRQKLVENHNIEAIIGMPSNMFFGTGIPTIIMILKKNRKDDDILFVDASYGFEKDGNKNKLRSRDVRKIIDAVINRSEIEKFSRLVPYSEIVENEFNLNITRYINLKEDHNEWDIYSTMYGGIPNKEIDYLNMYWDVFKSLKNDLFEPIPNIPYSTIKSDNIKDIILNNIGIIKYKEKVSESLSELPKILKAELIDDYDKINIAREESKLSGIIKEKITKNELLDYYDAYQILDNYWNIISLDLEILQSEGLNSLNIVDPNMIYKKKDKEVIEVQDGWIGRILSFDIVERKYFSTLKEKLDDLIERLSTEEDRKENLISEISPDDLIELYKEDTEEIETKKLNAAISKAKKEVKMGAEFDEFSFEDIILKINDTNESIKITKREIKQLKESLELATKEKIESLPLDEALTLLEDKWIKPLVAELEGLCNVVIDDLITQINILDEKYSESLTDINNNIKDAQKEISSMINELNGNEFDLKGINQLKRIIDGDENE